MSEFRKVAKGAIIILSTSVITAIFLYLSKIFLARILGPTQYGLFVLSMTIGYIFSSFTQSGVAPAISYFIPRYRKKKGLPNILSTLFWISSIAIFVVAILFVVFPNVIGIIFGEPKIVPYLPYILVFIIVYTYTNFFVNIFKSYENAKVPALVSIIRSTLFLFIGVSLTYIYRSFFAPLLTYIFIYVLLLSILIYLSRKLVELSKPSRKYAKNIIYFSFSMFIVGILSMILRWTDVWMISYFMESKWVGIYNVATSTSFVLNFFISAFMFLFFPIATRLISEGKKGEVSNLATKIIFWNTLIVVPIFSLFFLFSRAIVYVLFGARYILASLPMSILVVGILLRNIFSTNGNILLALNQKKKIVYSSLIGVITNVILNFVLIPIYGISGAAVATSTSLFLVFLLRYLFARQFKVAPNIKVTIKPLLIAILIAIPVYVYSLNHTFSLISAIIVGLVYLGLYTLLVHLFVERIDKVWNSFISLIR